VGERVDRRGTAVREVGGHPSVRVDPGLTAAGQIQTVVDRAADVGGRQLRQIAVVEDGPSLVVERGLGLGLFLLLFGPDPVRLRLRLGLLLLLLGLFLLLFGLQLGLLGLGLLLLLLLLGLLLGPDLIRLGLRLSLFLFLLGLLLLLLRFLLDLLLRQSAQRRLSSQIALSNRPLRPSLRDQLPQQTHIDPKIHHNIPLRLSQTTVPRQPILQHNPTLLLSPSMTLRTQRRLKSATRSFPHRKHLRRILTLQDTTPITRRKFNNGKVLT